MSGVERLEEALNELKDCYQRGDFVEMAAPIEDARAAARCLDERDGHSQDVEVRYREDCLSDSVVAQDLYPRERIHDRVLEHCREGNARFLDELSIDADELDIRWCAIEDGVLHYKVTHEDLPEIEYKHLPTEGPNTSVVPAGDTERSGGDRA